MSLKLQLISRTYCHLCDEMVAALSPLSEAFGFEVEVIDVDADPTLEARYNESVPVLLHAGNVLCYHFLDVAKLRDYLSKIR